MMDKSDFIPYCQTRNVQWESISLSEERRRENEPDLNVAEILSKSSRFSL